MIIMIIYIYYRYHVKWYTRLNIFLWEWYLDSIPMIPKIWPSDRGMIRARLCVCVATLWQDFIEDPKKGHQLVQDGTSSFLEI